MDFVVMIQMTLFDRITGRNNRNPLFFDQISFGQRSQIQVGSGTPVLKAVSLR